VADSFLVNKERHGMRVTSISVVHAMLQHNLISVGVLSGNRNWENRAHPHVKAHYLASPLLVITYALAGTVDIDFESVRTCAVFSDAICVLHLPLPETVRVRYHA
jgi:hypothetical protein